MPQLFANNAYSVLNEAINDTATSIALSVGTGSRFPSPTGGDYFLATLVGIDNNGAENAWEIVKCTARTSDNLTVVRAQEGTTGVSWAAGTRIELRVTAAQVAAFEAAYGWGDHASAGYQAALVSGTNIKTVNGSSLLGGGNLVIAADAIMDSDFSSNGLMKRTGSGTYTTVADTDVKSIESIIIACSDETTPLTVEPAKVTFRMPYAFTLTAVRASVTTAPTGAALQVDINEGGASILSTKLTIDAGEKTSTTAATPAVISDSALVDDAEITIDIDVIGSTVAGAGLKVTLVGYRT